MKKQLKDSKYVECVIKIKTVREYFRDGNMYSFGKCMWEAEIDEGGTKISFMENTKEKLFEQILSELHLIPRTFGQKLKNIIRRRGF